MQRLCVYQRVGSKCSHLIGLFRFDIKVMGENTFEYIENNIIFPIWGILGIKIHYFFNKGEHFPPL